MARVQFGHGAVFSDRLPEGVDAAIRQPSASDETGRSWKVTRRPDTGSAPVVESVARMRQPQWAQKLWFESRSLVRPQLAQRATGFFLARRFVRYKKQTRDGVIAKLLQTPQLSNPLDTTYGQCHRFGSNCRKFSTTTTLRPCRQGFAELLLRLH